MDCLCGAPPPLEDDLLTPDRVADPHPYFHRLRREDPVRWSAHHRMWLLTRADDVECAAREPRLSADRVSTFVDAKRSEANRDVFDPIGRLLGNWMVFRDPPDHGRLRRLVHQAFTARGVEHFAEGITEVVASRLAALREAGEGDFLDLVAGPIPAIVIARLLGVPAEDHERFRAWSDALVTLVFGNAGDAERYVRAHDGLVALERYFRGLLDERRRRPTDDLLSALARAEEAGDRLTSDEVIANCILLLFAGHETTTNLLANGMLALLRHPESWRALRADPSLAANAVEETLRFEGPSKAMMRIAVDEIEIRGRRIRPGERVLLVQAAANRDPERFPEPDRFDVRRRFDEHVGFGYGIHYCLGAPLARLEGRIAFAAFARELAALELAGEPAWHPLIVSRGLRRLPVRLAYGSAA